ncbi:MULTISPECIES: transglycosylase domain-containing protein [Micromonospora]|uniref:Penicillin-binding protein n=1 Tax=Micromonospora solifontis TaxID=2487138 RepID=A0ABX9WIX8_9ACTN|nr:MULTISPECIES: transglycosylase domain-containing protein [Micromonospora]NES15628.1 penicillin-binding protein [Micromonospora sp. PPF5-17B]NES35867.1 penicillin-binding protein [Micromonospora solifontis]NES56837.1 penicillin-binding protein [Micromonospora sp. PPF5-6]RNM00159.1 penicillin-binding protein [Micromonospora solifontis]
MNRAHLDKLFTVLLAGVLAGLALAAAALPAALVFGLGFKNLMPYTALPESLRTPQPAQRSNLYANDGRTLITSFYVEDRVDVPVAEVAPVMRQAIVAAEDVRFYQHHGVDLRGVVRAFTVNRREGGTRQGASTLTMQYVRNALAGDPRLTEQQRAAATEVTVGRKVREMRYALALERELSKDEILGRYLNIAYFGAGAYGIAAASKRYFSTTPDKLTLAQAALLAGLVRSPDTDDPINGDADAAIGRRAYVLDRMVETGQLAAADAVRAKAEQLHLKPSATPNDCAAVPEEHNDWAFFCDWFTQWWNAQPAFGKSEDERQRTLRRGGWKIVTSLDPDVQRMATEQVLRIYATSNQRAAPTAVVQPGTGRVLAMAVNRTYSVAANPDGQQNYPNTVNQLVAGGGGIVGYQAGSTFKLFALLAALESGLPLDTDFDAPRIYVTDFPVDGGPASCGGYWCPENASPSWMDGHRTMWSAFGRSVNTYFAWLTERVGADRVVEMAQRLGIVLRSPSDAKLAREGAKNWGPFTLGVVDTTPLDVANAYATVAAEGVWCRPTPVTSITDATGRKVAAGNTDCRQVLDTDVARAAADASRCPVGDQSMYRRCDGGTAEELAPGLRRPLAGKTGSSERNATETVVAFTPQLAVATIAANPDNPQDAVGGGVQTRQISAVGNLLAYALRDEPVRDFVPPSQSIAYRQTAPRTGN